MSGEKLVVMIVVLCLLMSFSILVQAQALEPYSTMWGSDLSQMDLLDQLDLLLTLSFDNETKWPGKERLPEGFDPAALLEAGKEPGLGIGELQSQGFTGAGVVVAYVDQGLLLDHPA